jgi:DNA-binding HxlR family transcriptional regulator
VKREYGQYCSVAKALDVVGGRWTLLIVRELLFGPRRFKDLLDGLPGIGTNLLSDRLRHLEEEAVIERRTLPPPAGSTVYDLTELGRGLEPIILDISRWGWNRIQDRDRNDHFHPRWLLMGMKTGYDREAAAGVEETYEFRIGDEIFHVRVDDGVVDGLDGPAPHPDLVVHSQPDDFLRAGDSRQALAKALKQGKIRVEGDPVAREHCMAIFSPVFFRSTTPLPAAPAAVA